MLGDSACFVARAKKFVMMQLLGSCSKSHDVSKKQKQVEKLLKVPPPKDLSWSELEAALGALGFDFYPNPAGGSHGKFKFRADPSLVLKVARPHPLPVVGAGTVKNIVQWLRENNIV